AVEHVVAAIALEAVERTAAFDDVVDGGADEGCPLDAGHRTDDDAVPGDVAVAGEAADVEGDADRAHADPGTIAIGQDCNVGAVAAVIDVVAAVVGEEGLIVPSDTADEGIVTIAAAHDIIALAAC